MSIIVEIKKEDSGEEIEKKVLKASKAMARLEEQSVKERKERLSKLFGSIKLNEDPVVLQRRWRDEW